MMIKLFKNKNCSNSIKKLVFLWLFFIVSIPLVISKSHPTFNSKTVYNTKNKADYNLNKNLERAVSKVDMILTDYSIIDVEVNKVHQHIKLQQTSAFHFNFEDKSVLLELYVHDILSPNFKHIEQTAAGKIIHPKPEAFTYRGVTDQKTNQPAVFTIRENWMSGFFTKEGQQYFITPLSQYASNNANDNLFVLFNNANLKSTSFECNVGHSNPNQEVFKKADNDPTALNSLVVECTEMAVAYDQGFKTLHGGAVGVQNIIISRLNLVSNLYTNWFDIDYLLLELYEADFNEITPENNFESCQENFPNCTDGTILDDFREWGEGQAQSPNFGNGFTSNPDVATFWTSRDIVDGNNVQNIGYSHFEGICNDRGYNICEDAVIYQGNEPMQMTLWAHELGHTWNAYHTNQNNSYMMNSSVSAVAVNVDNATVNSIANHKATRTCLNSGVCSSHCNNGIQDADETGVDCGGADCLSCPTCSDGILNGLEIGIDCGGPDCPSCPAENCSFIDFNSSPILDYDSSQDEGTATIQGAGAAILLENNAWKAIDISYTVTPQTYLTFEFKSTLEGEIHDIGFDNDLNFNYNGPPHRAVVYGNQGFYGNLPVSTYSGSGNWESFEVNIGNDFSGFWQYLVFTADDDGNAPLGNSYFRNIQIFEDFNGNQLCDDNFQVVSLQTEICQGDQTTLTATGAVNYSWSPTTGLSSSTGSSVLASPSATTTYTVTGTNANGTSNTAQITVTVNSNPVVSILGLPSSSLSATPIVLNGTPAGGTFTGPGVVFNAFNPSVSGPGVFTIIYSYTDANGCSGDDNGIVLVGTIEYNFINYNLGTIIPLRQLQVGVNVLKEGYQSVKVFNAAGHPIVVESKYFNSGENEFQINLPDLPKGIYFIQIGDNAIDGLKKFYNF